MSRTDACAATSRSLYPGRLQLLVQVRQHARTCEVDGGRNGQIAHHQLQRPGGRADLLPYRVAHVLDVEIDQRRFGAEDQRARNGLVVRIALDVGKAAGAGNAPEEGHVRICGAPDQQQQRHHDRHDHTLENAHQQHGGEGDHRHDEFVAADAPDMPQLGNVDQSLDRHEHDGGEHDVGQVGQQSRQVHEAERDRDRREHQRERRLRAGLVVYRGLRQPARHRVGLEQRRSQIRGTEAEQLLARVDFVAVRLRERPCRRHAFHVRQQQARKGQRNHAIDIAHSQSWQVEVGQSRRQCADDLEPEIDQGRH